MNEDSAAAITLSSRELRRAREQEERRLAILSAAEAVFSSKGFHGASISQIAEEAGFATGTIYLYFKDKAELYGSVILEKMRQMIAGVKAALTSDSSAVECLKAFVIFQFSFHEANRQFYEIFLNQTQIEISTLQSLHWAEMEKLKKELLTCVQDAIAAGQAAGELRAGEPRLYAIAFLGVVLQMIRQSIREGEPTILSHNADFAADLFLNGARASRP